MSDEPTNDPKIGFGNLAFAVSISTATARLQARYYRTLIQEGIPPEHAKDLSGQTVVALLENAGGILSSMGPAAGGFSELAKQAINLVDHPLVKEYIQGSTR